MLLHFIEQHSGKAPTSVTLADVTVKLVLAFFDHLERTRGNGARSRNARLAAIRCFLKYAALWLGHESPTTTHMYVEADLSMKERALDRLQPPGASGQRYRPTDQLMQFLQTL